MRLLIMWSHALSPLRTRRNVRHIVCACLALAGILFLIAAPLTALAQSDEPQVELGGGLLIEKLKNVGDATGVPTEANRAVGLPRFAGQVVRGALALVGLVFFVLTIYGGALWLTAGGNEEQVKKARSVIVRAAIGILIVLFAGAITQFITTYLAQPVTPTSEAEQGPEYVDTTILGGCPEGYSYILNAPDATGIEGAACRRN